MTERNKGMEGVGDLDYLQPGKITCRVHGKVTTPVRGIKVCPECNDRRLEDSGEVVQHRAAMVTQAKRLEELNLPPRLAGACFADWKAPTEGMQHAVQLAREVVAGANRTGLIFSGRCGTGKSTLGAAIAVEWIQANGTERGRGDARMIKALDLIDEVRNAWRDKKGMTDRDVVAKYTTPGLLVLDEIGDGRNTTDELVILQRVICDRHDRWRPTLLITNLSTKRESEQEASALEMVIGSRAMDRMRDGGRLVAFDWDGFRGKKGRQERD